MGIFILLKGKRERGGRGRENCQAPFEAVRGCIEGKGKVEGGSGFCSTDTQPRD